MTVRKTILVEVVEPFQHRTKHVPRLPLGEGALGKNLRQVFVGAFDNGIQKW